MLCLLSPGLLADKGAAARGISHLVTEWDDGIMLDPGAAQVAQPQRTQPVRVLEGRIVLKQLQQHAKPWRTGAKMRKAVLYRKPIWLAYERRIQGHPLTEHSSSSSSAEAMQGGNSSLADTTAVDAAAAASSSSGAPPVASSTGAGTAMTKEAAVEDLEVLAR